MWQWLTWPRGLTRPPYAPSVMGDYDGLLGATKPPAGMRMPKPLALPLKGLAVGLTN